MSTWEERMAARARQRRETAEAAQAAREAEEEARLTAANPALAGENTYVIPDGEHRGHRTHMHPWHWNRIVCSCGAPMGFFSIIIDPDGPQPEPEPCPVCIARGIPLN